SAATLRKDDEVLPLRKQALRVLPAGRHRSHAAEEEAEVGDLEELGLQQHPHEELVARRGHRDHGRVPGKKTRAVADEQAWTGAVEVLETGFLYPEPAVVEPVEDRRDAADPPEVHAVEVHVEGGGKARQAAEGGAQCIGPWDLFMLFEHPSSPRARP